MLKSGRESGWLQIDLPSLVQLHLGDDAVFGSTEKGCAKSAIQPYDYTNYVILEGGFAICC